jgi:hypothetical protein
VRALLADPVVDWHALGDVLWTALLGGVGVTAAFAVTILGATRAGDLRRSGNGAAATAYGVLMFVAMAIVLASIVFAIVIMQQK